MYANTAGAYSSSPSLPPLGRSDHNLVHLRPVYTPMVKRQPPPQQKACEAVSLRALLLEKRRAFQSGDRDELRRVQRDLKWKIKECKASYRRQNGGPPAAKQREGSLHTKPSIGVDDAVIYLLQRSLSHLEDSGNTVRITFFDFSSAFNTILPLTAQGEAGESGASDQLAAWVTNYLTDRPQFVRLQDCVSDVVVCSTGAPPREQSSHLSSSPCTHRTFTYSTDSCHLQKFSDDDTAIVGCVSEGKRLDLRVRTYKYLGVHLNNKLDWTDNTDSLYKKGQSRLYMLRRRLGSFGVCRPLLRTFYETVVASVVSYAVVCWGGGCSERDKKRLNRLIKRASSVCGCPLELHRAGVAFMRPVCIVAAGLIRPGAAQRSAAAEMCKELKTKVLRLLPQTCNGPSVHQEGHTDGAEILSCMAKALKDGHVVAVPTDTIYGLACLAQSSDAIRKTYDIKGRNGQKPLAICVGEIQDIYKYCKVTVTKARCWVTCYPGPSLWSRGRIRIPDHDFMRRLCQMCGEPLALTSANISSHTSTVAVHEFQELWPKLAVVVDGGPIGDQSRLGSTVVNLSVVGKYRIIRPGCSQRSETGLRSILEVSMEEEMPKSKPFNVASPKSRSKTVTPQTHCPILVA
ncbi:hypothetical protein L3Q82_013416 [Scortum barcoo]|uniref:Uncharacterized protein n=1 Tax=Scortum barcoo TaxID=214431 RepID=A0ACB8W0I7_9TELE|nr:hypothetical protein L3Q82_013416 [Scortum barcoo]